MNTLKTPIIGLFAVIIALIFAACKQPTEYPPTPTLTGITADYTQGATIIYPNTPLDSLKAGLTVTAKYSDNTTKDVTDYALSGTLEVGASTVTVTYEDKTTTFNVTVTAASTAPALTGITAVYNGTNTIYPTTPLDTLKTGLTVKAQYSNGGSEITLSNNEYALSGTLTVGASAVTVTYEGKTTTFNVTVTAAPSNDITYTATQTGGADNIATTTGIGFTFTAAVSDLTADDITVTNGTGEVTAGALTGSDTLWSLAVTVTTAGNVTVSIDKTGIEAEPKHVTVYKAGETAPTLTGITAVYNGTNTIYPNTPLDTLKTGLTVKAQYSNGGSEITLSNNEYALSGTLTVGDSALTVTYKGKITTFTVTVTAPTLTSITAVYTQGSTVIYPTTQLDSLKTGLTITAAYSNGTTLPVTAYALSGTLTAGASTVTVIYEDQETTFTVNVTALITYTPEQTGGADNTADSTGIVFTFSASVDSLNLTAADITVGGAAAKGSGALTGSGTSRTLPVTVNNAGLATVSITKSGIEADTKSVSVHKKGAVDPEYWSVTWNLNGGAEGTGAYPAQIVKGEVLAQPSPHPTKAGHTFGGWYTDSGLTTMYNFANPVTADLNLYAKWTLNQYTVTFSNDDGTPAPVQQTVDHGGKVTEPATMTKTGYTFGGWYKEAALTNQWNFTTDTVTTTTTLYAKWTPNSAGITINIKQIEDETFTFGNITISRTGIGGNPVTVPLSVENASAYSSIEWEVAGVGAGQTVTGTGASFTLSAQNVNYNSLGGHVLILTVKKGTGINALQYIKVIPFIIVR